MQLILFINLTFCILRREEMQEVNTVHLSTACQEISVFLMLFSALSKIFIVLCKMKREKRTELQLAHYMKSF